MAFSGVLGHVLDGSGGDTIMVDALSVVASGSMNFFLAVKHYNRCKQINPILAISFKVLHIKKYLCIHDYTTQYLEVMLNRELLENTSSMLS